MTTRLVLPARLVLLGPPGTCHNIPTSLPLCPTIIGSESLQRLPTPVSIHPTVAPARMRCSCPNLTAPAPAPPSTPYLTLAFLHLGGQNQTERGPHGGWCTRGRDHEGIRKAGKSGEKREKGGKMLEKNDYPPWRLKGKLVCFTRRHKLIKNQRRDFGDTTNRSSFGLTQVCKWHSTLTKNANFDLQL